MAVCDVIYWRSFLPFRCPPAPVKGLLGCGAPDSPGVRTVSPQPVSSVRSRLSTDEMQLREVGKLAVHPRKMQWLQRPRRRGGPVAPEDAAAGARRHRASAGPAAHRASAWFVWRGRSGTSRWRAGTILSSTQTPAAALPPSVGETSSGSSSRPRRAPGRARRGTAAGRGRTRGGPNGGGARRTQPKTRPPPPREITHPNRWPMWNRCRAGESDCLIETQLREGTSRLVPRGDFCPVL